MSTTARTSRLLSVPTGKLRATLVTMRSGNKCLAGGVAATNTSTLIHVYTLLIKVYQDENETNDAAIRTA